MAFSCSENSVTEDEKSLNPEQIAGLYNSIVFTAPGPDDGIYDILASGGMITVRLFDNFEVEGHLLIPDSSDIPFTPIDDDFYGTFTLNADTVRFKNTGIFLDHEFQLFKVTDNQLRAPDRPSGRWPQYVIFEKQ